jgi:DNA replicative helicase MCM subunit Mcm2 (Cdc46/Mcm family)
LRLLRVSDSNDQATDIAISNHILFSGNDDHDSRGNYQHRISSNREGHQQVPSSSGNPTDNPESYLITALSHSQPQAALGEQALALITSYYRAMRKRSGAQQYFVVGIMDRLLSLAAGQGQ